MNPTQPQNHYRWKGKTTLGEILKGETASNNVAELRVILKTQGIISCKITQVYSFKAIFQTLIHSESKKSIKADITLLIRQLSMLVSAHIPLMQALEVIGKNEKGVTKTMKKIIADCQMQVKSGHTLSYAFDRHQRYFDPLFCRWIEAGERSGTLDILLEHWVVYQEKSDQMRQKIKKALTYPVFILVTATIIAMVLLIGVVPVFEKLFHQFGAELPLPTQYVIKLSTFFQQVGIPLFIFLSMSACLLWRIRHYFPKLLYLFDQGILKIPLSGKIIQEAAIARLSRSLSIMLLAGFPLSEALEWTKKLMGNVVLVVAVSDLRNAVVSGMALNVAMTKSTLFPSLLKQMVAVGEASGTLDKTLAQTATFYETAIANKLDNLSQLIEPVIMVVLGVFMGGFILAMYMPIFQLGSLF